MLSLDLALTREQKNQRLKRLRSLFALYFGFVSDEQIAQALAYQQVRGQTPQVNSKYFSKSSWCASTNSEIPLKLSMPDKNASNVVPINIIS